MAAALLALTFLIVFVGCVLWAAGYLGWAQLAFVAASGTAGAGIVLVLRGKM